MRRSAPRGRRGRGGALAVPVRAEAGVGVLQVVADPGRPGGRLLLIDGLSSGYVDLHDAGHLGLDYLHRLGAALDALLPRGAPAAVVHLGGGAFTLPRWIAATRPAARQEVYELDPVVVDVGRRHLRLRTSDALRVRVGDARALLERRPAASADVVIGDAFQGTEVPRHLTTLEFARDVRRVLCDDGVYLLNVVDTAPQTVAPAVAAALVAAFPAAVAFGGRATVRRRSAGNVLFAASAAALDPAALERRLATGPYPSEVRRAQDYAGGAAAPRDPAA